MEGATTSLPPVFLIAIGTLVVCNLGVIITVITFIFKAGMFVTATKMGIKDSKDAAIRAHKRIDGLEKSLE
jgi:hypothetical protein